VTEGNNVGYVDALDFSLLQSQKGSMVVCLCLWTKGGAEKNMKRTLIGLLLILIAACHSDARQVGSEDRDAEMRRCGEWESDARSSSENLAAQVDLFNLSSASDTSARGGKRASEAAQRLCSEGVPTVALPPCRWQLGVGVESLRFRSDLFSSSVTGLHPSLTYFTNNWYGIEGILRQGLGQRSTTTST
jgi:hypothetical protein